MVGSNRYASIVLVLITVIGVTGCVDDIPEQDTDPNFAISPPNHSVQEAENGVLVEAKTALYDLNTDSDIPRQIQDRPVLYLAIGDGEELYEQRVKRFDPAVNPGGIVKEIDVTVSRAQQERACQRQNGTVLIRTIVNPSDQPLLPPNASHPSPWEESSINNLQGAPTDVEQAHRTGTTIPCEESDTAVLRSWLDANGLQDVPVDDIASVNGSQDVVEVDLTRLSDEERQQLTTFSQLSSLTGLERFVADQSPTMTFPLRIVSSWPDIEEVNLYWTNTSGNVSRVAWPSTLQRLNVENTRVTGDVGSADLPSGLAVFVADETNLAGSIGSFTIPESLEILSVEETQVRGDIGASTFPDGIKDIKVQVTDIQGDPANTNILALPNLRNFWIKQTGVEAYKQRCFETSVDDFEQSATPTRSSWADCP